MCKETSAHAKCMGRLVDTSWNIWLSSEHDGLCASIYNRYNCLCHVIMTTFFTRLRCSYPDGETHVQLFIAFESVRLGLAVRHADKSKTAPNREITAICYLNPNWNPQKDGGQVCLYPNSMPSGVAQVPRRGMPMCTIQQGWAGLSIGPLRIPLLPLFFT
jgi:hypothetical protein